MQRTDTKEVTDLKFGAFIFVLSEPFTRSASLLTKTVARHLFGAMFKARVLKSSDDRLIKE